MAWFLKTGSDKFKLQSLPLTTEVFFAHRKLTLKYAVRIFHTHPPIKSSVSPRALIVLEPRVNLFTLYIPDISKSATKIWYITFYTNVQKLSHLLSPSYRSHQIRTQCSSMTKHFIHKKWKSLEKCTSKIYKTSSTNNRHVMYLFCILQFVFLEFNVEHPQVMKCLQIRNTHRVMIAYGTQYKK